MSALPPDFPPPRRIPMPLAARKLGRTAGRTVGRTAGGGLSWQTMLADLALILFMVTAAAMGQNPKPAPTPTSPPPSPPPSAPQGSPGEPVAVWRAGAGAPSLSLWLAGQQADPRLTLTIAVAYAPGGQAMALAQASSLAREAGAPGRQARIVVALADAGVAGEAAGGAIATLAYDRASSAGATNGANGTPLAYPGKPSSQPRGRP